MDKYTKNVEAIQFKFVYNPNINKNVFTYIEDILKELKKVYRQGYEFSYNLFIASSKCIEIYIKVSR